MLSQVLYDKEISVALYREPENTEPDYRISIPHGYEKNMLPNNKLSWLMNKGNTTIGSKYPLPVVLISMAFYRGTVRRVFVGYRNKGGKEYGVYKHIYATGGLYYLDTIDDMKRGVRPDGSLFKTGDRIRVKENGRLYNVVVDSGISEIDNSNNTEEEELAAVLYLNSTSEGLKPDMSLTISLLPGQNCYNAVLKVRNLNLADTDIRSWTRMVITAGYRTGSKATYICPIFASYIEEPNPDGITVFEGLTVGKAEGVVSNCFTEITFAQEKMKLIDLTKAVAQGISPSIKVECAIDDDIMNTEINISKQTVYAQNGMAILSWLQTTISKFIQNISTKNGDTEPMSAFIQLDGDILQIIALNGPNKKPQKIHSIISLDMVSGATFNGTALTVTAPWNPSLKPGGLFYMPPEFINGSKLPNVLAADDYRNDDNLYRALTISIAFASVENANRMEILAVPAQWAGELPESMSTSMRADLLAQSLGKSIEKRITVGNTDGQELSAINNIGPQEDDTKNQMFDTNRDLIAIWGAWETLTIDSTKGNCLSKILEYYFLVSPGGPKLQAYKKGDHNEASFYKDKKYFENKSYKDAIEHFQSTGCSANVLWWPLTVVGTYWRKQSDEKAKVSNNWSKIDISNPNQIQEGRALYIPIWAGTWDSQLTKLTMIRDIWKWAYIEYRELYPELCNVWRAMYYYLGGPYDNELK